MSPSGADGTPTTTVGRSGPEGSTMSTRLPSVQTLQRSALSGPPPQDTLASSLPEDSVYPHSALGSKPYLTVPRGCDAPQSPLGSESSSSPFTTAEPCSCGTPSSTASSGSSMTNMSIHDDVLPTKGSQLNESNSTATMLTTPSLPGSLRCDTFSMSNSAPPTQGNIATEPNGRSKSLYPVNRPYLNNPWHAAPSSSAPPLDALHSMQRDSSLPGVPDLARSMPSDQMPSLAGTFHRTAHNDEFLNAMGTRSSECSMPYTSAPSYVEAQGVTPNSHSIALSSLSHPAASAEFRPSFCSSAQPSFGSLLPHTRLEFPPPSSGAPHQWTQGPRMAPAPPTSASTSSQLLRLSGLPNDERISSTNKHQAFPFLRSHDSDHHFGSAASRLAEFRKLQKRSKGVLDGKPSHFAIESPRFAARMRQDVPMMPHQLVRLKPSTPTNVSLRSNGLIDEKLDDAIKTTMETLHKGIGKSGTSRPPSKNVRRNVPVMHLTTVPMANAPAVEPHPPPVKPSHGFGISDPIRPLMRDSAPPPRPHPGPKAVAAQYIDDSILSGEIGQRYSFEEELGSGGFGFVVGATRKLDGLKTACKFIWRHKVPQHQWVSDPHYGPIPMEAFILKVVRHPHIVQFIELFQDDRFFFLVMERHGFHWNSAPDSEASVHTVAEVAKQAAPDPVLVPALAASRLDGSRPPVTSIPNLKVCSPSDLFECIDKHSYLAENTAQWIFAQVVEAVYCLESLGIYHRDIKDENCVIDSDFNVKLIDFGSAVITDLRKPQPLYNKFFGTLTFASAEILQGKPYYAPSAEVWSLGVLLSILITGNCPFTHPDAAIRGELSSPRGFYSQGAWDVLLSCLSVDINKRIKISELRNHPWVAAAWSHRTRPPIYAPSPRNDHNVST